MTQPFPTLPTVAERARTALRASPTLEIVAGGVAATVPTHATDARGRPVLLVGDRSPLATLIAGALDPVPMLIHAAALRPVRVPDRVRTRVELCGYLEVVPAVERDAAALRFAGAPATLRSGGSLLRGEVLAVRVDGTAVDPDAYADAAPDPLVDHETACLRDLLGDRPGDLAEMCALVEPELLEEATEIAPSGLDRHGLTVWLAGPEFVHEVRLPFAVPVDRADDVPGALRRLLAGSRTRAGTRRN